MYHIEKLNKIKKFEKKPATVKMSSKKNKITLMAAPNGYSSVMYYGKIVIATSKLSRGF